MKPPVIFVVLQTGARANGGLQSIGEVMRRLKDHRPIVLTNLDSAFSRGWRSEGMEVHVVPEQASAGLKRNPLGAVRAYRQYHAALRAILRNSGARVVHANDPLAFQLSYSACAGSRARLILNLRDTIAPDRKWPRFKYRLLFGAADHVLYLSREMAEHWRAVTGNAEHRSSITYSIVDPARFPPAPPPAGNRPVVLVPGIFWPKKGQLEFIRNVVPELAAAGITTRFAGDFEPNTNSYARACANAAGPVDNHVEFLGFRSGVVELMHDANVIAVPSRHEGLMRGMIEAMSCGRPVVSFDVCSAREVLEQTSGKAGVVLPMGDYKGMADALLHFAKDRESQIAAGRAASAIARNLFDPDEVVERYERVYRSYGSA